MTTLHVQVGAQLHGSKKIFDFFINVPRIYTSAIADLGRRYKFAEQKAAAQNIAGQTPRSEKAHRQANTQ